jgi:hypothetical protein
MGRIIRQNRQHNQQANDEVPKLQLVMPRGQIQGLLGSLRSEAHGPKQRRQEEVMPPQVQINEEACQPVYPALPQAGLKVLRVELMYHL